MTFVKVLTKSFFVNTRTWNVYGTSNSPTALMRDMRITRKSVVAINCILGTPVRKE